MSLRVFNDPDEYISKHITKRRALKRAKKLNQNHPTGRSSGWARIVYGITPTRKAIFSWKVVTRVK